MGGMINTCLRAVFLLPDIHRRAEERSRAEYSGTTTGSGDEAE